MAQPHTTTGTTRRPAHVVSGQGLTYRLPDEIDDLWRDLPRTSGHRAAKTLAKSDNLRVALIALEAGTVMEPQALTGGASLHVLQGRLNVYAGGQPREVQSGELVILSQNLREQVEAPERCAFLAMVAWPDGAGAWQMEAASGRLYRPRRSSDPLRATRGRSRFSAVPSGADRACLCATPRMPEPPRCGRMMTRWQLRPTRECRL